MHPTVKPVALVADAMRDCSMKREIVLDTYLGSGTTVLAAEKTGRQGLGMEYDPAYVDVAVRRWQAYARADAILVGDGRTFDEIEADRVGSKTTPNLGTPVRPQATPLAHVADDPDADAWVALSNRVSDARGRGK